MLLLFCILVIINVNVIIFIDFCVLFVLWENDCNVVVKIWKNLKLWFVFVKFVFLKIILKIEYIKKLI